LPQVRLKKINLQNKIAHKTAKIRDLASATAIEKARLKEAKRMLTCKRSPKTLNIRINDPILLMLRSLRIWRSILVLRATGHRLSTA